MHPCSEHDQSVPDCTTSGHLSGVTDNDMELLELLEHDIISTCPHGWNES